MKGANTLIVNGEQMVEIVQEWWSRHTYSSEGEITLVKASGESGNFFIEIKETAKEES